MGIAVVIVNYNTREHLRACLESVAPEKPAQVVVVDNASADNSARMVREQYSGVELIEAGNEGFGAGANVGVAAARHPFVVLLNSDTLAQPGSLAALQRYLETRPQVGLAGPRLLNPDGTLQPSIYPVHGPLAELLRWTSLGRLAARVRVLRETYLLNHPHDRETQVGWVVGAALALRTSAFDAVGGFDPSFFMYSEEVDLAYRMRRAGWSVRFTPDAEIVHVGGASTAAQRAAMMSRLYNSVTHFYQKHYGRRKRTALRGILTYFMLRNLARDRVRLVRARSDDARRGLADDLAAWRCVLATTWNS